MNDNRRNRFVCMMDANPNTEPIGGVQGSAMVPSPVYLVLSFTENENGELIADQLVRCSSGASAFAQARALQPHKAGVVAFSRSAGASVDEYDPNEVLFAAGRLPQETE